MNTTLSEQIIEVRREIALRKNVYEAQVRLGKMKRSVADRQIEIMQAVLATLQAASEQQGETLL